MKGCRFYGHISTRHSHNFSQDQDKCLHFYPQAGDPVINPCKKREFLPALHRKRRPGSIM